jgi:hypothetical protein
LGAISAVVSQSDRKAYSAIGGNALAREPRSERGTVIGPGGPRCKDAGAMRNGYW